MEFIHPFAGRTVIRERQNEYYRALAEADERAEAAPFVEFMLRSLLEAIGNSELSSSGLRKDFY